MSEHMRENLHVSIPRSDLARWLNRSERRIGERIKNAPDAGLLSTVVRGQKGVTAVYGGLFPDAFSRTHGGPTSSYQPPELSPRGGDSDEKQQRREARGQSRGNAQAEVDHLGNETRSEEKRMTNVVDLLSRRQRRGDNPLHFTSAAEALAFATTQIRELEHLADSALVIAASDLNFPLARRSQSWPSAPAYTR